MHEEKITPQEYKDMNEKILKEEKNGVKNEKLAEIYKEDNFVPGSTVERECCFRISLQLGKKISIYAAD